MSVRRFCKCELPAVQVDRDGNRFCNRCSELLPEAADVVLPVLVRHVAALERRVEALQRDLVGGPR